MVNSEWWWGSKVGRGMHWKQASEIRTEQKSPAYKRISIGNQAPTERGPCRGEYRAPKERWFCALEGPLGTLCYSPFVITFDVDLFFFFLSFWLSSLGQILVTAVEGEKKILQCQELFPLQKSKAQWHTCCVSLFSALRQLGNLLA